MVAMETVTPSPASSLGRASLSASRAAPARPLALEQRAMRVRQVIHALRERAAARDTAGGRAGGAPAPLRTAIEDFGRELAELERRLSHDGAGPAR
jgi:hypothetical protein